MSNNIFYKALATINTIGIVLITGAFVIPQLDKGDATISLNLFRSKALDNESAQGDLGKAEDHHQNSFNVWCGTKKNDCKVTFDGDRLRVNDGEGIRRSQISYIFHQRPLNDVTSKNHYTVVYKKIKTKKKGPLNYFAGTFILKSLKDDHKFKKTIVRWTGKPIGLEASNGRGRGGGVFLGNAGASASAAIRNANQINQMNIQQIQHQNKLHSLPPQYRGTVNPPYPRR